MPIIPLWAKAVAAAVAIAACSWLVHLYNESIRDDQRALDVAEYSAKLIESQEKANTQELQWREQSKKQQEKTNELLKERDSKYSDLVKSNNSLRNAATNYGNGLPSDSIASCRARAAAIADVFGQCGEALRDMAKAADGQYIDAVNCREQWPK